VSTARVEALMPQAPVERVRKGPPCALVVFGASGDLTRRKLVPALYNLDVQGSLRYVDNQYSLFLLMVF